jgi:hypothetical protein
MKNPYENKANILVGKNITNTQQYINKNIKDTQLNITINEIIEYSKYKAFEEGILQSKCEVSQILKDLINIEEPDFN